MQLRETEFACCALYLVFTALAARPARAQPISWSAARDGAESRAPAILVAERRGGVAAEEVHVAEAWSNPVLTFTTSRYTAKLSGAASLPLPLFGQRGTAVRAAEADASTARLDVDVVRSEMRWNATLAWVDTWQASERARLLALTESETDHLLGIARDRFDAGTAPQLDVIRATADQARARADAEAAAGMVAASASQLAVWLGLDPREPLAIAGGPSLPDALPPIDVLMARAAAHPRLRRDEAEARAADRHVEHERRLRFPAVSLELAVNVGDPTLRSEAGSPQTDVVGGVSFELPLLSLRQGAIARARARRDLAEAVESVDSLRLRADLEEARRRTLAAERRARTLRSQALPQMELAREMTEESYRAGRADLIRVLEAERAVLDMRLAQSEAVATWARSYADLERAVGQRLDAARSETGASHDR